MVIVSLEVSEVISAFTGSL